MSHTSQFIKLVLGKLPSALVDSLHWSLSLIWSQWSFHRYHVWANFTGTNLLNLTNMMYIPMAMKSLDIEVVATNVLATMAIFNFHKTTLLWCLPSTVFKQCTQWNLFHSDVRTCATNQISFFYIITFKNSDKLWQRCCHIHHFFLACFKRWMLSVTKLLAAMIYFTCTCLWC